MTAAPALETVEAALRARAIAAGFDVVGIAPAGMPARNRAGYLAFVGKDRHAGMAWLAREPARRADPRALWPDARSVIALGADYTPAGDPMADLARREEGVVAAYAKRRDYHDVIKKRLKEVGGWLAGTHGARVKVFVDTAPVLEKPLAQQAGLGWQGKHTNLVSRRHGSWLLLGEIFTDLALRADAPEADHCGSCRRCLDVCPTDAFPKPYQLDARRCISYLTIEHKGHIERAFRVPIGNRIFGCDDCLAVCPWNKFAQVGKEARLGFRGDLDRLPLADLAALDDAAFRERFRGTPIKRTGRDRFVRNVLIAIGNSGAPSLVPAARARLADPSPLVRAMAVWALSRLLPRPDFEVLRAGHAAGEPDPDVNQEWELAG